MIQIITDSTFDASTEHAKELGVHVVPLSVHFGEESYLDGITIDRKTFYSKLEQAEKLPTTSQPSPQEFLNVMTPLVEQGDEIVGIFISSKLSGTYQSASLAASMIDSDRIHLVDSLNVTIGLEVLVEIACHMRDAGKSAGEIVSTLEDLKGRVRLIAMVDTLKYLQMGGRISAATAMVGNLLGINPLIGIVDGLVESVGKARGKKSAYRHLLTMMEQDLPDTEYPIIFTHSQSPESMEDLKKVILPAVGEEAIVLDAEVGSVIGTHAGPGAAGLAYIARQ